jgi:hypothetical protein
MSINRILLAAMIALSLSSTQAFDKIMASQNCLTRKSTGSGADVSGTTFSSNVLKIGYGGGPQTWCFWRYELDILATRNTSAIISVQWTVKRSSMVNFQGFMEFQQVSNGTIKEDYTTYNNQPSVDGLLGRFQGNLPAPIALDITAPFMSKLNSGSTWYGVKGGDGYLMGINSRQIDPEATYLAVYYVGEENLMVIQNATALDSSNIGHATSSFSIGTVLVLLCAMLAV